MKNIKGCRDIDPPTRVKYRKGPTGKLTPSGIALLGAMLVLNVVWLTLLWSRFGFHSLTVIFAVSSSVAVYTVSLGLRNKWLLGRNSGSQAKDWKTFYLNIVAMLGAYFSLLFFFLAIYLIP